MRVLRTGGRLLLADFRYIADDQQPPRLRHRDPCLGSGYWYGGPWAVTTLFSIIKRWPEPLQQRVRGLRGIP